MRRDSGGKRTPTLKVILAQTKKCSNNLDDLDEAINLVWRQKYKYNMNMVYPFFYYIFYVYKAS